MWLNLEATKVSSQFSLEVRNHCTLLSTAPPGNNDILFFFFFNFLTLQYCIGFAIYQHESNTGIYMLPILNPPPSSLPVPSLWVVQVHQPQASSIVHRTWTGDSFHIWYYTCFSAILPNHPTLSLSQRVRKTVLYISVSFAVSYTGLLLLLSKFHIYALLLLLLLSRFSRVRLCVTP